MKAFIAVIFLFSVTQFNSFAQDKGYLALSLGPSFPVGNFGSNDLNNEKAGLAKLGTITDFSFAYRFGKNIGLAAMLRWQSNGINTDALLTEAKNIDPTITWKVTSENWKLNGILAGIYSSFPVGTSSTCFEVRTMIGYMSATLPQYSLSGTYNGVTLISKVNSQSTSTVAFLLGAGFRLSAGKKVSILMNVDYSVATAEFIHVSNTTNFGSSSNFDFKQEMKTVNMGFGIGLRL